MSKPKQKKSNELRKIREHELKREVQFGKGETAQKGYFTPQLTEICASVIAETFESQPNIEGLRNLEENLYDLVIAELSPELDLEVAVKRVDVPSYWRDRCDTDKTLGLQKEGMKEPPMQGGWKRLYLERYMEVFLMSLEANQIVEGEKDFDEMIRLCAMCGQYIYKLNLTHQRCHFDIAEFFKKMAHLQEFSITYGVVNVDVNFTMDMLGMNQPDALSLREVLKKYPDLRVLNLPGNKIDSALLKMLLSGLVTNTTLHTLDLSHNKINDEGATALGTLLMKKDLAIKTLCLNDNSIRETGARALGKALAVNSTLEHLHLKMNRLGDVGGQYLVEGLRQNSSLKVLNLANNQLGAETARSFNEVLGLNRTLKQLDISGNNFQEEGGSMLVNAVESNMSLLEVDVRYSGIASADEETVSKIVQKRVTQQHMEKVDMEERKMQKQVEEIVRERVGQYYGLESRKRY